MRRASRALSPEDTDALIERGEYGVLCLSAPDGGPYGVPLSYVHLGDSLYFHCADRGFKLDCIRFCSRAHFVIVGETRPVYDGSFTTLFESAMVEGTLEQVQDGEKKAALLALAQKYLPEYVEEHARQDILRSFDITTVLALRIESRTGKAKRMRR
ncbi:MAG: pyridoxamine 5'-phosphate oxidase family protein [Desulfovibrionaceae bacterium]|nr:pyridoxamine 5'-phosphate oxidase family protein [Desulfovibrionaceae bacterium]